MYQVIDGRNPGQESPMLLRDVFLFGEEGIPLQGNRVINRFVNFPNDQLLIWLMHHKNRDLVSLDGVVLPLYGDWGSNFWHWCSEALPSALLAHEGGFSGTYLVPPVPFAADSLKLLGIKSWQIRAVEECDYHLECMCLLPKLRGNAPAGMAVRNRASALFRAFFGESGKKERLYISRNGRPDNMRKVVNEEQVLELLEGFGFTTLRLEELSLAEQLHHSCNAEALVGPHGAGMTHCAFMPQGSLVVELFAPSYINPCVILPCKSLRHRYFQMTSPCLYSGYQHALDIEAHIGILEMTLERELSAL